MDPNHRDRIAFLRLCSGQFAGGMKLTQMGTGKVLSVNSPILFFAREREIVDEAWPGDIIGIPTTACCAWATPSRRRDGQDRRHPQLRAGNPAPRTAGRPMKSKQLKRALEDLAEEGVTQVSAA